MKHGLMLATFILISTVAGAVYAGDKNCTLEVKNLVCPACSYMLKTSLLELSGVKEVSFDGAMTTVTYDDDKTTVDALIKVADGMGYPATQVQ